MSIIRVQFLRVYTQRCEECGSMFSIKSRLKTHQNTVHIDSVHKCQICDKSFKSLSMLKRHTFIHSRFKPYACPFCNHSSNSQSNLTKHVRKIHSKEDFSYHKYVIPNSHSFTALATTTKLMSVAMENYCNQLICNQVFFFYFLGL